MKSFIFSLALSLSIIGGVQASSQLECRDQFAHLLNLPVSTYTKPYDSVELPLDRKKHLSCRIDREFYPCMIRTYIDHNGHTWLFTYLLNGSRDSGNYSESAVAITYVAFSPSAPPYGASVKTDFKCKVGLNSLTTATYQTGLGRGEYSPPGESRSSLLVERTTSGALLKIQESHIVVTVEVPKWAVGL